MRAIILAWLLACTDAPPPTDKGQDSRPPELTDLDNDGYLSDEDCDDVIPTVHPGASEICDGLDNNCDGAIDEGVLITYYADTDADGFGDADATRQACATPEGYVPGSTDCDDSDADNAPGQPERCDGQDNDCDDEIDEGATDTFYVDSDGDGYGDPLNTAQSCDGFPGVSDEGTDCDDTDPDMHPGADEYCNDLDDDCDGSADEAPTVDGSYWYPDADGDSYGDGGSSPELSCLGPLGYADDPDDCDDRDVDVHPGAEEVCANDTDDDCDGDTDEGCPVEHCGNITADETWTARDPHIITCEVNVGGTAHPVLTIEDGAEVSFVAGTGLFVAKKSYGTLRVEGDTLGVTFTAEDAAPAPGAWVGIEIGYYDEGSTLSGFTLSYAGGDAEGAILAYGSDPVLSDCTIANSASAGLYAELSSNVSVDGCTFQDNASDGVTLESTSTLVSFANSALTGNGGFPITVPGNSLGALGTDSTYTGNGDDRIQVTEDQVDDSATWADLGLPLYIVGDVEIEGSAAPSVTIEDGVALQFAAGVGLTVGVSGRALLEVDGDSAGVIFGAEEEDGDPGDWSGITFGPFDQGSRLTGATVRHGGGNGYGGIYVNGADLVLEDSVVLENGGAGVYVRNSAEPSISDCSIQDNDGYGLYVDDDAGLLAAGGASFSDNVVTGNDDLGVVVPAVAVAQLDASSTYAGNGADGVRVLGGDIDDDATWQLLDQDYLIDGDITVEDTSKPVLTLEAGVTLRFEPLAGLQVGEDSYGALAAAGTRSAGVTLTSSQSSPAAGDWDGVSFGSRCVDVDVALQYVTVSYGGGNGYANLLFDACDGTVSNATISDSAAWGIYRASGASPTLTNVSYSGNASGTVY